MPGRCERRIIGDFGYCGHTHYGSTYYGALHGQHALGDHLARVGRDDVDAEHAVRLLVREELDHAVGLVRVRVRGWG